MSGPALPNTSLLSAIQALRNATAELPQSTPEGLANGVVWKNFSMKLEEVQGPIFEKIDQAFTRCFPRNPGSHELEVDNVLRGVYGMEVVIKFFEQCAYFSKMTSADFHLTTLKVKELTDLVYMRIKSLPPDKASRQRKQKRSHPTPKKRPKPSTATTRGSDDDTGDSDYEPRVLPNEQQESDTFSTADESEKSEPEVAAFPPVGSLERTVGHKRKKSTQPDGRDTSKKQKIEASDAQGTASDSHTDSEHEIKPSGLRNKPGPKDDIRQWALSNFSQPTPAFNPTSNKPVWEFKCKYCRSVRRLPRSGNCAEFLHEIHPPSTSNLASHLHRCTGITAEHTLNAARARSRPPVELLTPAQVSLGAMFKLHAPVPKPPTALTPSAFRSTLIQGVIRDNYPLRFGEGAGMKQVFAFLNSAVELPSHQTLRRDLDQLSDVLTARVQQSLMAQTSRFAVSSDAWTSKNFSYSLAGVIITFIDAGWNMQELVLDVAHLDADHKGASMGRKLFKSLDRMHAAGNIIASVTDNASNNRTMNAELAARAKARLGMSLRVDNMSVTCLCHALHLICGAILYSLKAMDSIDSDDAYAAVKSFAADEIIEESAEVLEEEELMRKEGMAQDGSQALTIDSDDEQSESEDDEDADNQPSSKSTKVTPLNPLQKVHAIAVHCTASTKRRKKMRVINRSLGLELLAVIKGLKIRWNSMLAEVKRARRLKLGFNQYVATLDEGKSAENNIRAARNLKKKLTITDEEWDVLDELIKILEPFEWATHDFSKRGRTVLCSVLPTYALLRTKLAESRARIAARHSSNHSDFGLLEALTAGEAKLEKYFRLARESDLTLIASVLHPGMRLVYFRDTSKWGDLMERGRAIMEYLYEIYTLDSQSVPGNRRDSASSMPKPAAQRGWIDSLLDDIPVPEATKLSEELKDYFDGKYRYNGGDILVWWKEHELHLPIVSRIARDFLAIPATSVSVERLFSRCRLVMSDYRHMSVETARRIITCQQWLQAGLGVDLPDFVS